MKHLLREQRNNIIVALFSSGLSQSKQGKVVHLSQQMVSKILGKRAKNLPICEKREGAKSRLSDEQIAQLPTFLSKCVSVYGFEGEYWTQARVKYVIEIEFGVIYGVRQVGRILEKIGWTRQKPQKKTFNKI